MANILHIETSGETCSVALSSDGLCLTEEIDTHGRAHAAVLPGFVREVLSFADSHALPLDAVAISSGPGSYTGLRIGLSEAKGLCYALDIPLIGVSTLELMATRVVFSTDTVDPESILVPMIDARRMEVYTAAYDFALTPLLEPQPLILDAGSYRDILATGRPVLFFGDGMPKAKELLAANAAAAGGDAVFVDDVDPLAVDMLPLAEREYARRNFLDLAYSVPAYLKAFQATKPRNPLARC